MKRGTFITELCDIILSGRMKDFKDKSLWKEKAYFCFRSCKMYAYTWRAIKEMSSLEQSL